MKCKVFLESVTTKAHSNKLELLFTSIYALTGYDYDLSFPSGQFSISVNNPALFDSFIPGNEYDIELSIVVDSSIQVDRKDA